MKALDIRSTPDGHPAHTQMAGRYYQFSIAFVSDHTFMTRRQCFHYAEAISLRSLADSGGAIISDNDSTH